MLRFSKITRLLTSMRLAVILLSLLAVFSAISTLIPQGEAESYYLSRYGILSGPILFAGFNRFFSSVVFLGILIVFAINLLSCLLYRLIKMRHIGSLSARGADIVHLGILMLIAAGLLSVFMRTENRIILAEGEGAVLPGGYSIILQSLETVMYPGGGVKEWISKVQVIGEGEDSSIDDVKVNSPLRIGYLRIYQYSVGEEPVIRLVSAEAERVVSMRNRVAIEGGNVEFMDINPEKGTAVMQVSLDETVDMYRLTEGARLWQFVVAEIGTRPLTVLMAIYDPGFFPAVVSFLFIFIGLGLVFYRRIIKPIQENEL